MNMNNQDTICAVATAPGGAIGIIRISGEQAVAMADKIFKPATEGGRTLSERKPNTVTFGRIYDRGGQLIDEVLASVFRAPHSYTGEDSVEFSCHGSSYILQRVIEELIACGCRQAEPGEYTQRAFMNGKMDLSQAEAVADLIASQSAATHRMAISQMRGDFSNKLSELRDKLLHLTSLMELELDFSDHEELEFADRTELKAVAAEIEGTVSRLMNSFALGNAMKNGVPVAIVGETNAGKSTLLNALVGDERAIVSNIHGTTRDVIEDTVNIGGTLFRFIDTAGIRDTRDEIESLGIERTFKKISQAQIVLWIVDSNEAANQIKELADKIIPLCQDKHLVIVMNKADIAHDEKNCLQSIVKSQLSDTTPPMSLDIISISAKQQTNLQALKDMLLSFTASADSAQNDIIVSNLRHYNALSLALDSIHRVQDGLSTGLPTDLVAQDLRDAISQLAEITGGEISSVETLSNIFKHFCVGK